MTLLQIIGLALDLVGVTLLGADLVRVQLGLRKSAEGRIQILDDIAERYGGLSSWSKELASSADWQEYADVGEGLSEPVHGAFDPIAAKETFAEAMGLIETLHDKTNDITNLVVSSYRSDLKTAASSLKYSYLGLALIILGFLLQIFSLVAT